MKKPLVILMMIFVALPRGIASSGCSSKSVSLATEKIGEINRALQFGMATPIDLTLAKLNLVDAQLCATVDPAYPRRYVIDKASLLLALYDYVQKSYSLGMALSIEVNTIKFQLLALKNSCDEQEILDKKSYELGKVSRQDMEALVLICTKLSI